jgi:BatD DUF11 like domain
VNGARAAAAAAALGVLVVVRSAAADVTLHTEVSPRKVEIGDRFVVRFSITSDGRERISDPQLKVPDAVRIYGQSVAQGAGVTITWMLTANRAGKYKLGPASVLTSQGRSNDKPVTVEVVAQGTLSSKQPSLSGQPSDPLSMLRGFGGSGFPAMPGFPGFPGFPDEPEAAPQLPALPEGYKIERAADPIAFLRASAEPHQVVVGEQVTLSGYAYAGRGDFGAAFFAEPTRDDFLAVSIGDEDGAPKYPFDLEGRRWLVSKIASYALFPLKAGKLKIGSMSIGFSGPGYSNTPQGLLRKSAPLEIDVVEPPLQGRPPGYHLGDVGNFRLNVQVQPREVPIEGSISVVAKLEGSGNFPFTLLVPEREGVHFLEPQLVEQIAPQRGVLQGFRTFTYVVELTRGGEVDLGEITLPYYDAKARAYGVARAALGRVKVTGTAKPVPSVKAANAGPSLKTLLKPPAKMSPTRSAAASFLPSRAGYWLLLFALPLSAVLGFALSDLTRLLRQRLSERRGSLSSALEQALAQLAAATRAGEAASVASAAERVLFLAIERATGLKARGVLKAELAETLTRADVPREVAELAAQLLRRCDQLRFAGEAVELASFSAEVRAICQQLGQRKAAATAREPP